VEIMKYRTYMSAHKFSPLKWYRRVLKTWCPNYVNCFSQWCMQIGSNNSVYHPRNKEVINGFFLRFLAFIISYGSDALGKYAVIDKWESTCDIMFLEQIYYPHPVHVPLPCLQHPK
jgi:hypothetical protein